MEVFKRLLLRVLRLPQLLHQVLFHVLQLTHLIGHPVQVLLALLLLPCILLCYLLLLLRLGQRLILEELTLVLLDLDGAISLLFGVLDFGVEALGVAFLLPLDDELF
jgi:hypothetical protein